MLNARMRKPLSRVLKVGAVLTGHILIAASFALPLWLLNRLVVAVWGNDLRLFGFVSLQYIFIAFNIALLFVLFIRGTEAAWSEGTRSAAQENGLFPWPNAAAFLAWFGQEAQIYAWALLFAAALTIVNMYGLFLPPPRA